MAGVGRLLIRIACRIESFQKLVGFHISDKTLRYHLQSGFQSRAGPSMADIGGAVFYVRGGRHEFAEV
jgi:hypothetical protein